MDLPTRGIRDVEYGSVMAFLLWCVAPAIVPLTRASARASAQFWYKVLQTAMKGQLEGFHSTGTQASTTLFDDRSLPVVTCS